MHASCITECMNGATHWGIRKHTLEYEEEENERYA